jgi:hypothetical protein
MAINAIGQCAPCCKQLGDCETCSKCYPKYLCVTATITSVGYGDSSCHCNTVNGRIFSQDANCGWYGVVSCANDALSFRVHVEKNESGDCQTVVEAIEFEETFTFSGVLEGIAFSGSYDGVSYDVTIVAANMFKNPLAFDPCPKCACAVCLPREFCAIFHDLVENTVVTASLPWLCESRRYDTVVVKEGLSVGIALSTEACELVVTSDVGVTTIQLESDQPTDHDLHGIVCAEGSGNLTRGNPPFGTVRQPGFLVGVIEVMTDGMLTGILTVQEKPCEGECEACPNDGSGLECCPIPPDSLTCTATLLDDEGVYCCEDITFEIPYNPAGDRWEVFGVSICGHLWDVVLMCAFGTTNGFSISVISQSEPHGFAQNLIGNLVDCPGVLFAVTGRLRMFSAFDDPGCTWEWVIHS